jgi:hypothetical protein
MFRRADRALLSLSLLTLAFSVRPASATCGATNCFLVTGTQEGIIAAGTLMLDLSYRYVDQSRRLMGDDEVSEVLTPKIDFEDGTIEPGHHREIRTQNTQIQLDLSYGLTGRLTLAASLPLINDRDHEHFDEVGEPEEHFTRTDGASGFGDARLGVRAALLARPRDLLVGGLSLELPTGPYRLRDGDGEINEPTIQPGSGSIDLVASLHYTHQWHTARLESFVSGAHRRSGDNDLEYRMGDETLLSAGLARRGTERVVWILQANGRRTGRDRFMGAAVPSTGATFVNLTPGLRFNSAAGPSFYVFVQVPLHQRVNEVQIAPRSGVVVGASKTF